MKVSSRVIRQTLNDVWPTMHYVWLWDNTYWMSTEVVLDRLLKASKVPEMQFMALFNDCDNYALQFLAETRRKRYISYTRGTLPEEQKYPISVGFAFGNMFRGISKPHAANVGVCEDGVYIVDAMQGENRMWKATPENDNMLFIFM